VHRRIRSGEFGRLEVSPSRVAVGSRQLFILRYVAGARPLTACGRIRLLVPLDFPPPNMLGSWASGFARIVRKPGSVEMALVVEPPLWQVDGWASVDIILTVLSGVIRPEERVEVEYGGAVCKAVVPPMAGRVFVFDALVDPDGSATGPHDGYTFVQSEVPIETTPLRACRMEAYVPSVMSEEGLPSTALVVKKDAFHNCVSAERMAVASECCSVITGQDGQVARVEVCDDEAGLICRSNPRVRRGEDNLSLFWGDLHCHTNVSEAAQAALSPDESLAFARYTMGLDFLAVIHPARNTQKEEWRRLLDLVKECTESGEFVAFPGFEFYSSEKPGKPWARLDKNVIFRSADDAEFPPRHGLRGVSAPGFC